jgi:hypothetical protein
MNSDSALIGMQAFLVEYFEHNGEKFIACNMTANIKGGLKRHYE